MKNSQLHLLFFLLLLSAALLFSPNQSAAQSANEATYTLHEGELNGAPYKVAVPDNWPDGNVFFHVHGWRPADAPHEADLDMESVFYRELIDMGWAVARTAFYENGVDNDAHMQALSELSEWINDEIGTTGRIVMEGESTAGSLVLRIAEIAPDLADGVIAKGAFVNLHDETADSYLEGTPKIPSVLMSNLTELDEPVAYAAVSEDADYQPALRPLLRPGHVNVNSLERLNAFLDLNRWLDTGQVTRISEGTRTVPERNTGTTLEREMLVNEITSTDRFFGNAKLGFHPSELDEFGIYPGDFFILEINGQEYELFYGESYGDVPEGEWVAFPTADDHILVAINYGNAVQAAGIAIGDRVAISRGY